MESCRNSALVMDLGHSVPVLACLSKKRAHLFAGGGCLRSFDRDLSRLRGEGGITSRAVKAKGHVLLCPHIQRCDAWALLRHLQLLLVLLWGDGGAAEWDADDRVVGVCGVCSGIGTTNCAVKAGNLTQRPLGAIFFEGLTSLLAERGFPVHNASPSDLHSRQIAHDGLGYESRGSAQVDTNELQDAERR